MCGRAQVRESDIGVSERPRPEHRTVAPAKGIAHRFVYLGLVLAAFGLMLLGKADNVLVERFRAAVSDAVAPVLEVLSSPIDATVRGVEEVKGLVALHSENSRLREERDRLLAWQTVARQLEAENAALRSLLRFEPGPGTRFIAARVIADTGGAFAHSLLVNAGRAGGVDKGQAVVVGEGLVGRVASAAERSARVLLITDLNSRLPVVAGPARTRAILAGDNTERPKLIHLVPEAALSLGDRVVTSGHAGAFPPGLPIGIVSSVGEGSISVEPFVDRSRIDYVRIINYGLSGILRHPVTSTTDTAPADSTPVPGESSGGVEP